MKIVILTLLTLVAFALNSILNRFGVAGLGMDPGAFAVVRVAAGAAMLGGLVLWRGRSDGVTARPFRRLGSAAALALYMIGFSMAYLTLDAGVGALILFGTTQITMFAGALFGGEQVTSRRVAGAALALAGLAVLVWPAGAGAALPVAGAALMASAGLGWGLYSLAGRAESDPLASSAANFVICLPLVLPLLAFGDGGWSGPGLAVAALAGAVTSGLGYALWYAILPGLGAQRAAVAQLSVPLIAALGGVVLLGEGLGWRFWASSALVLGGIGLSVIARARRPKTADPRQGGS